MRQEKHRSVRAEINDPLFILDRRGHVSGPSVDPTYIEDRFEVDLGERTLWRAVVQQAVSDIERGLVVARRGRGDTRKARFERGEVVRRGVDARAWVFSEATEVGSLRWICDQLGLRVQPVRDYANRVIRGE